MWLFDLEIKKCNVYLRTSLKCKTNSTHVFQSWNRLENSPFSPIVEGEVPASSKSLTFDLLQLSQATRLKIHLRISASTKKMTMHPITTASVFEPLQNTIPLIILSVASIVLSVNFSTD